MVLLQALPDDLDIRSFQVVEREVQMYECLIVDQRFRPLHGRDGVPLQVCQHVKRVVVHRLNQGFCSFDNVARLGGEYLVGLGGTLYFELPTAEGVERAIEDLKA